MDKPKVLVFASGGKEEGSGGSGFMWLVEFSRTNPPVLDAEIIGVVSNHPHGGVSDKARSLEIPFFYWPGPFSSGEYRDLVRKTQADYVMLSGWLKYVTGLNPEKVINIHPGPAEFGGPGMYGHHVHEAVIKGYQEGKVQQSAVVMHFVDSGPYDSGPIIFEFPVPIRPYDTADSLAQRVNEVEHAWQAYVLNCVVRRSVYLQDGKVYCNNEVPAQFFKGIRIA